MRGTRPRETIFLLGRRNDERSEHTPVTRIEHLVVLRETKL